MVIQFSMLRFDFLWRSLAFIEYICQLWSKCHKLIGSGIVYYHARVVLQYAIVFALFHIELRFDK